MWFSILSRMFFFIFRVWGQMTSRSIKKIQWIKRVYKRTVFGNNGFNAVYQPVWNIWNWLSFASDTSNLNFFLLKTGIFFMNTENIYFDEWSNFGSERTVLFKMVHQVHASVAKRLWGKTCQSISAWKIKYLLGNIKDQ